MCNNLIENLESRVLLSAAPALFNPTLRADRLAIRADLLRFRSDILSKDAKLLADTQAIRHDLAKGDTSLAAPFAQMRSDVKAMGVTLREDRLTESAAALKDESSIKLDIVQILKDRKNATAEAADHDKLHADRVQLQNDLIAGLDSRIATRQAQLPIITNDVNAIVTAAQNDPNASSALQTAVNAFANDRTATLNTLSSDLQAISAARATLVADLTAAQAT